MNRQAMRKVRLTPKIDDKPPTPPSPGELKAWRRACGKTQREAADWLRVPLRTYQKWEQGERAAHNPGPIKLRMAQLRSGKPRPGPPGGTQQGFFEE